MLTARFAWVEIFSAPHAVCGTIAAVAMTHEIVAYAIVAALSTGATDTAKSAIDHDYQGLKSLITIKLGDHSDVAEAMDEFEANPDSFAWKILVAEELKAVNSATKLELVSAAQSLPALIEALPPRRRTHSVWAGNRHRSSRPWRNRDRPHVRTAVQR
jgi:hypothetical protein